MQPLIDGDILLHEIGWSGEFKDKETKEEILLPTEHVFDLLDKKIQGICHDVEADAPPIIFFSDSEWLAKKQGREYVKGFRYDIAKTKPYKGNRLNPKPFHFYNLLVYMLAEYNCQIATDGEEADDLICYTQVLSTSSQTTTIICSRDKDVRIAPGWHFSWECGDQRAIGPIFTDANGWLEKRENGDPIGYGTAFFYYQMLVGDSADNIPGLPKFGKTKAYNLLSGAKTTYDQFTIVKNLYKEVMGDKAKEYFMEQANLLWMRFNKEKQYALPTK